MKKIRQLDSLYSKTKLHNEQIHKEIKDIDLQLFKIKLADKYGLLIDKDFLTGQYK